MAKKENTIPTIIDTPEALTAKIAAMKEAQKIFATFTQEQVDKIFKAAATAADKARIPLAKDAVEETGMGIVEDKVIKNHYAAEYVYNAYKNTKTCGVIEEDTAYGIKKIAEPIGLIAAVIPTTNPTSTAIFKTLIALKTRNAIIISPHPRAKKCTIDAAKVVLEAAVEAGAPEGIIGWIDVPSLDLTNQVMREADIILATGGPGMVKAAYSSGKPALGVGPGNTPVIIDDSADIRLAVNSIIHSKTFDNGMICASEQSVTVLESIYKKVKEEFLYRGCYFLKPVELEKYRLEKYFYLTRENLKRSSIDESGFSKNTKEILERIGRAKSGQMVAIIKDMEKLRAEEIADTFKVVVSKIEKGEMKFFVVRDLFLNFDAYKGKIVDAIGKSTVPIKAGDMAALRTMYNSDTGNMNTVLETMVKRGTLTDEQITEIKEQRKS